jgi:hypothetical protein
LTLLNESGIFIAEGGIYMPKHDPAIEKVFVDAMGNLDKVGRYLLSQSVGSYYVRATTSHDRLQSVSNLKCTLQMWKKQLLKIGFLPSMVNGKVKCQYSVQQKCYCLYYRLSLEEFKSRMKAYKTMKSLQTEPPSVTAEASSDLA